ncbi:MAG: Spy/CpxP family protein refolding chaperone [Acidobacteriota bacterium]|nr:Spy/CpxP family protein refolding chaperone [Acidobacteriota bacterium]
MSIKQKIVSVVATGFVVVSFSAFASAQNTTTNQTQDSTQKQERREHRGFGKHDGEERRGGHHGDRMGMRELEQLNLTDAQKQQIHDIMKANRPANPETFQEMRTLSEAKRNGTITAEQTERLKTLKQQMRQNMEQTHQQVLAILTPEQRTQLEQLKEKRKQEMKEHRKMRQDKKNSDTEDNDDN